MADEYITTGGFSGNTSNKVYSVLLTQSGLNEPHVVSNANYPNGTPFENTVGAIIWTYIGSGTYSGTLNGAFALRKCFFEVQPVQGGFVYCEVLSSNTIYIYTNDSSGSPADGLLNLTSFRLTIYP